MRSGWSPRTGSATSARPCPRPNSSPPSSAGSCGRGPTGWSLAGHYAIAVYAVAAEIGLLDEAAGDLWAGRLGAGSHRHRAHAGTRLHLRLVGRGLSRRVGFALADRLRGRPKARTLAFFSDGEWRGAGRGGGDVRGAPRAGTANGPAGREQLAGQRPGGHHHDHRAGGRQVGGVRLGRCSSSTATTWTPWRARSPTGRRT